MSGKKATEEAKFKTISIPMELYEKIEKRIKETDFASVSSYVTYVLEEILAETGEEETSTKDEDEEKIKARLRALGYVE